MATGLMAGHAARAARSTVLNAAAPAALGTPLSFTTSTSITSSVAPSAA